MNIIPFSGLTPARQKALQALTAMRNRADRAMQDAQMDHGTQSPQFTQASARYEQATDMLTEQTQRTRMPEHPLYVSPESAAASTCPACGSPLGVNPQDGKLGCPHVACCYLGDKGNA
jgi:hypothetical protein